MTVPVGFQTRYFHTTSASDYPVIVREGNMLIIPCFIEAEAREDGGENYTFYAVPVPFAFVFHPVKTYPLRTNSLANRFCGSL